MRVAVRSPATGELYGNGFVEFMDVETATLALQSLSERSLPNGWNLHLNYALPVRRSGGEYRMRDEDGNERDARGGGSRRYASRRHGGDWGGGKRGSAFGEST